jgi:hypothetical protein
MQFVVIVPECTVVTSTDTSQFIRVDYSRTRHGVEEGSVLSLKNRGG